MAKIELSSIHHFQNIGKLKSFALLTDFKNKFESGVFFKNVAKMGRIFNICRPTVYEYLKALEAEDMITHLKETRQYKIISNAEIKAKYKIISSDKLNIVNEQYNLSMFDYCALLLIIEKYLLLKEKKYKFNKVNIQETLHSFTDSNCRTFTNNMVKLKIFHKRITLIPIAENKYHAGRFFSDTLNMYVYKVCTYEINEDLINDIYARTEE